MHVLGEVLLFALWIYFFLLIGRLVFDYVQMFARNWRPSGPIVILLEAIYTTTDPPLKALRRVIPPLRLGSVALDLGFLFLIIGVQILIYVVQSTLLN